MPCLVNGYLNYKGNSTSILWREITWVCSSEYWYRHTRWHGVVTLRITVLTSTAMKTPQSYVLHIYINVFYICLEQGFSRLLCWCITKWNLKIFMYIFFVQIHWGLSEQSDIEICDKQVPNCELISLAIKNLKYENWNVYTLEVTHPHCGRLTTIFKGVLSSTTQSP